METSSEKTYVFHVHGMHCNACVVLTESELIEHPKVAKASSSLSTKTVEIRGTFENMAPEEIARELSEVLTQHKLSTEPEKKKINMREFLYAVPIALAFIALFVILQKLRIVELVNTQSIGYGTAFIIGIIASLSTCMAVVGGLLLSMSSTFAKEGDSVRPQVLFHVGRIIAFFVLGGVIGALGSVFQFGAVGTAVLSIIIGLVMLTLGINLLDVFPWAKRLQPSMPKFLSHRALNVQRLNHTLTPFLVGIITFFLPCGFTQSMQIFTLSTGSFLQGGMTMLVFALGTLPVLAVMSFSSLSMRNSSKAGIFYKSAGLIVILFALFNLLNSITALGWIPPLLTF